MLDELLKLNEGAFKFGVSEQTLYRWARSGKLKPTHGRRVSREEINRIMKEELK